MNWKFIDNQDDRIKLLISALKLPTFPNELMDQEAIISEFLRDSIHKLTYIEQEEINWKNNSSVHTRKIIYLLRQQLEAVWPAKKSWQLSKVNKDDTHLFSNPLDSQFIKRRLWNLELLGEILHIGNGFWVPTPIRLIQLPDKEDIALIGGCSTKYALNISSFVSQAGLGRLINKDSISKGALQNKNLWQPYSQWVGWMPKDLSNWTEALLKQAQEKGASTIYTYDDFEIFTSFNSNHNFKSAWARAIDISGAVPNRTVLLCRTSDKRSSYFLGVFYGGQITKEFPIKDKDIISWLRIGLRRLHGRSLNGYWYGSKLKVYPPLPTSLDKIILLYSYKIKTDKETAYYVLDNYRVRVEENLKNFGYVFINR
ncbi:hypothetical protein [Bacillus sp. T33-2]|uniref:hypothetical protein n=1 Tax=Bacillus sp. T33-2 TaxID=2054168 RepID=UPI000C75867D|nr:hypothetical protein [Bacillus sp. T33-2]PLR92037.1 hypothetical protein CVD19_21050 [Bacillus sp. T33-2]